MAETEATDGEIVEQRTEDLVDEGILMARKARECPVPKPRGLIGEVLGFNDTDKGQALPVRVETVRTRARTSRED